MSLLKIPMIGYGLGTQWASGISHNTDTNSLPNREGLLYPEIFHI